MKSLFIGAVLVAAMLPAVGGESLPPEVQKFIDQREGCDHMRGEIPDPTDKRRSKALERETDKLCKGTDKELAQLKRKYQSNSLVLQRLNEFEPGVEPSAVSERPNGKARH